MAQPNHDVIVQAIELIESRIGIAVGKQFQSDFMSLYMRLADGKPQTYFQQLRDKPDSSPEWQRLINILTIGESYFLREETHFDLLRKHILPKLILQRRQMGNHRLRIWSAGCASGEEPYSIAIILHQFLPDIETWDIEIHGTDINEYSLQGARHAVYRDWAFRHTDTLFQQNYFSKVDGGYQLRPFIKDRVTFRQHNLMQGYHAGYFDVIFCKNVLLYFDDPYVEQVESHLYHALQSGGWLFMGQAEALRSKRDRWQTHIFPGSPIYQRPDGDHGSADIDYQEIEPDKEATQPVLPVDIEEDFYTQAVVAIHADDHSAAEQYLSLALENNHQKVKSHTLLAWIFANRKAFPEAEAHTKAALAIEPLYADIHYISALIALEQNQLQETFRALQMTLYCDTYHALGAFMLGNLYAKSGQIPKAFSQWTKVQRAIETLNPSDYVSDLSDLTAGQLDALISSHLSDA